MHNQAEQILNIYHILKKVLGEEDARECIAYFERTDNKKISKEVDLKLINMATKDDVFDVKNELHLFKDDTVKALAKLENKISDNRAELIKWAFVFIIGQTATIIAIIKLLF